MQVLKRPSYQFNDPVNIASNGTRVWVTNNNGGSVTELNASTGALVKVLGGLSYQFSQPSAVAFDGTHVWVTNFGGDSVTEFPASPK